MKTRLLLLPFCLLLPACGHDHDHAHPPTTANGTAAPGGTDHHGAPHPLGAVKCGAFEFAVTQLGDLAAGREAAFEVAAASGAAVPATVRAWIGAADAKGSRKARLTAETTGRLHGHVEAPNPLPDDAQLWLEVDGSDGTATGAIALHR